MSEIIFPSEVSTPVQVDWENPYTADLLTLQYDDGTTVTNMLTGATGEVFDVANIISPTEADGTRVSATWSTSQPVGVTDNPYSLFKTQETVQDEYALSFVEGTSAAVQEHAFDLSGTFAIEVDVTLSVDEVVPLFSFGGGYSIDQFTLFANINGSFQLAGASAHDTTTGHWVAGDRLLVRLEMTLAGTSSLFVNGNQVLTDVSIGTNVITNKTLELGNNSGNTYTWTGKYHSFKLIHDTDSTKNRFWEFNQTRGNFVKDHINGKLAQLVGFPADSGYVRQWGVSDGLAFTGTNHVTFPELNYTSGDFDIELEFTFNLANVQVLTGASGYISCKATGVIWVACGANRIETSPTFAEGDTVRLRVKRVSGWLSTYYDGSDTAYAGRSTSVDMTLDSTGQDGYVGKIKFIKLDNRYYDFTKIQGFSTAVPETINGQDGTMVGFDSDGVYVPEKNKVLVGQKFDGAIPQVVDAALWSPTGNVLTNKIKFNADAWVDDYTLLDNGRVTVGWGIKLDTEGGQNNISIMIDSVTHRFSHQFLPNTDYVIEITFDRAASTASLVVDGGDAEVLTGVIIPANLTAYYLSLGDGQYGSQFDPYYGRIDFVELLSDGVTERYYDFTIESGNTITDTSGNGNHGTVVGGELERVYDYSGYGEIVGYKFDGNTTVNMQSPYTTNGDFEIRFKLHTTGNHFEGQVLLGSTTVANMFIRHFGTDFLVNLGGADSNYQHTFTFIKGFGTDDKHIKEIVLKRVGTTVTVTDFDGNSLVSDTWTDSTANATFDCIGHKISTNYLTNIVYFISIEDKHFYDFTTGDTTKIIDTVGGNHATITNGSTVKWQQVLPVEVFTLGSASWDYADMVALRTAQAGNSNAVVGLLMESYSKSSPHFDMTSGDFANGLTIRGNGKPFTGDYNDPDVLSIAYTNSSAAFFDIRNNKIKLENLIVKSSGMMFSSTYARTIEATDVGFLKPHTSNQYMFKGQNSVWSGLKLKRCGIKATATTTNNVLVDSNGSDNFDLIDCILSSPSDDGLVLGAETRMTNSVLENTGTGLAIHAEVPVANLSHVITNDASVVDVNGLNNQDMTTWFFDSANNDLRIDQTDSGAMTALTGTGWNNSDIVSFAWVIPPVGGTVVTGFDFDLSLLESTTSDFDLTIDTRQVVADIFNADINIRSSVSDAFSVNFDVLVLAITVADFDLRLNFSHSVTLDFSANTNLLQTAVVDFSVDHGLLERVTGDYDSQFDLNQLVVTDFSGDINLLQTTVSDFSANAYFNQLVSTNFNSNFDVLVSAIVLTDFDLHLTFNQLMVSDYVVDSTFNNLVQTDTTTIFDVRESSVTNFQLVNNYLQSTTNLFNSNFDVLEGVSVVTDFDVYLNFNQLVTTNFNTSIDLLERVIGDFDLVNDLRDRVVHDINFLFDINGLITTDFECTLSFIGRVNNVFEVVFEVESDIIPKTPMHYVVDIDRSISFDTDEHNVTFDGVKAPTKLRI